MPEMPAAPAPVGPDDVENSNPFGADGVDSPSAAPTRRPSAMRLWGLSRRIFALKVVALILVGTIYSATTLPGVQGADGESHHISVLGFSVGSSGTYVRIYSATTTRAGEDTIEMVHYGVEYVLRSIVDRDSSTAFFSLAILGFPLLLLSNLLLWGRGNPILRVMSSLICLAGLASLVNEFVRQVSGQGTQYLFIWTLPLLVIELMIMFRRREAAAP